MGSKNLGGLPPSFVVGVIVCVAAVAYFIARPPSESEAQDALAAKYPGLGDKPVWFDAQVPTEEGFVCDLAKKEWKYFDRFNGKVHPQPRRHGKFAWTVKTGWQTADEWEILSWGCPRSGF